eukprot:10644631-Alexandrium_andersonii.AAC.1
MCIRDRSTTVPGEQAFEAMSRAAAMDAGVRHPHTLSFAASPADDSGAPTATVLHYVPCTQVDAGPWVAAESGVVARQNVHPASLASVTCCWGCREGAQGRGERPHV